MSEFEKQVVIPVDDHLGATTIAATINHPKGGVWAEVMCRGNRWTVIIHTPVWKYQCEECNTWHETSEDMRRHYKNEHDYSPVDATLVTRTSYTKYQSFDTTTNLEETR